MIRFFWLLVDFLDLASHCRLLLHDHPRHPRLVRILVLYPLYVFAEVAIIATDLAELLGSAIGLCLLFPTLPLWAGVVLTAVDVIVFLSISNPSSNEGKPVKIFEYTIIALVRGSITPFKYFLTMATTFVGLCSLLLLHRSARKSRSRLVTSFLRLFTRQSPFWNRPGRHLCW